MLLTKLRETRGSTIVPLVLYLDSWAVQAKKRRKEEEKMIGKLILLCVLIISCVFTWISVSYAISKKMAVSQSLIPIAFTISLGIGILLVYLGI